MTGEKFAEIVTKRANERVQKKLRVFKGEVESAFRKLTGSGSLYDTGKKDDGRDDTANRLILARMLESNDFSFEKGWPTLLWAEEEVLVNDELLSMMDEMQKALLSPGPKEDDCTAEVVADEKS